MLQVIYIENAFKTKSLAMTIKKVTLLMNYVIYLAFRFFELLANSINTFAIIVLVLFTKIYPIKYS